MILLTTSGLQRDEKASIRSLIDSFAELLQWRFSPDLTCLVTHVIVAVSSEGSTGPLISHANTDKLMAILTDRMSWPQLIVSSKWVTQCVREGKLVDTGPFEVTLLPPEPGCQQQEEGGGQQGRIHMRGTGRTLEEQPEAIAAPLSTDYSLHFGSLIHDLIRLGGRIGMDPEIESHDCDSLTLRLLQEGAEEVRDLLNMGTLGLGLVICEPERCYCYLREGFVGHFLSPNSLRRFFGGSSAPPKLSILSTDCLRSIEQRVTTLKGSEPEAQSHSQPLDNATTTTCTEDRKDVLRRIKSSKGNEVLRPPPQLTLLDQFRWTLGLDPWRRLREEPSQSDVFDLDSRLLVSTGITVLLPQDEGHILGHFPLYLPSLSSPFISPPHSRSFITSSNLTEKVSQFYDQTLDDQEVVKVMKLHNGLRRLIQNKYLNHQTIKRLDLLGPRVSFSCLELRVRGGELGGEVYEMILAK